MSTIDDWRKWHRRRERKSGVKDIDVSASICHSEFKSRDTDVPVPTESGDTSNIRVTINLKDQQKLLCVSHIFV